MKKFITIIIISVVFTGCQKLPQIHNKQKLSKKEIQEQIRPYTNPSHFKPIKSSYSGHLKTSIITKSGIRVITQGDEYQFIIPVDNFFKTTSSELRFESNIGLDKIVELIQSLENAPVTITGHTDHIGKPDNQKFLSKQLAEQIKNYLWSRGVPQHRITAKGYGNSYPISSPNIRDSNFNRRVEIHVRKPIG